MRFRVAPFLIALHLLALALLLALLGGLPLMLRAAGAWLFTIALPGTLLAVALLGAARAATGWAERGVAGLAAGYGIAIVTTLLLAYAPGGMAQWMVLGAFLAINLALAAAVALRPAPDAETAAAPSRGFWFGLGAVLALGALLRLTWLGYSEFQGDEARVFLRATDLLLGYENAVFVHTKPPGELLLAGLFYALLGKVTEAAARLPFALAGLGALAAITLLGRRLLGEVAGVAAGLLLAVDGYLIAFSRIVQYQSITILVSIVVILLLYDLWEQPRQPRAGLMLAAGAAAGGLLAHYDTLGVAIPALWLLWLIGRRIGWRRLAGALLPALIVAAIMAALFFVPWVRYPGFSTAYAYVIEERLGLKFPYNNLADFLQRTMLYSSSYDVIGMGGAALAGMAAVLRRRWPWAGALAFVALAAVGVAIAIAQPGWIAIGGRDLSVIAAALPLAVFCLLPMLTVGERTVWLWLAPLAVGALFLIRLPDSHVYVFFLPWALAAGMGVQAVWNGLARRPQPVHVAAGLAGVATVIVLAGWPWLIFSDAPAERFRNWETMQPRGYWYPFAQPPARAIMGFPLRNGWKAIGVEYAAGGLDGIFQTNARPQVADWYTRGLAACPAPERYFMLATTVEPTDDARIAQIRDEVAGRARPLARVTVNGEPRLTVYAADAGDAPADLPAEDHASRFDALTATPMQSLRGRVREATPSVPTDYTFTGPEGGAVRLRGYTLAQSAGAPGATLPLTLTWESLRPLLRSYTVFVHVVAPVTNAKVAQTDALPVCGQNLTNQWNPGDLIEDPQRIVIAEDAPPGRYRLYLGLYDVETGARLPITDAAGQPLGDFIDLVEIEVVG